MNEEKFTGKAALYAQYRPSYPNSLIDWLYEHANATCVADIGAGTGIFTRCLQSKPWRLSAVEPNSDMQRELRRTLGEDVALYGNSAENTGIPDNSVDLVTVAQAFHWFDEVKFKAECRRILTSAGKLAVIWNERVHSGISDERNSVCMKYCGKFHSGHVGNRNGTDGDRFLRNEYFSSVEYFATENNVPMTKEEFIGDTLSRSYALTSSDKLYDEFIAALGEVFAKYKKNDTIIMEYKTSCYLGTF